MTSRRHKSRRWLLQILYAWEVRGSDRSLSEEAADLFDRRHIAPDTREYAERVVAVLAERLEEIDDHIAAAASNWEVDRLAVIDKNVLRIAVAELLWLEDVPTKVTIDEAVTLAKRYGGEESPRFVNGVLDALAHQHDLIPS
ncbi:MAG: transcription antitermination factor NusB [Gemmatimonadota bacterium]|nr:transcription antitermination factor NusB [Gemmatimonadota bacterium]